MAARRARRRPRASERVVRTFLFSDLVNSTDILNHMTRRFGRDRGNREYWEQIQEPHNRRIEAAIQAHEGEVVMPGGDSYLVAFQGARQAILCAVAIQRSFINDPISIPVTKRGLPQRVCVKIGIHFGAARKVLVAKRSNYQDETINIAKRIQEMAHEDQVLISQDALREAGEIEGIRTREWAGYALKGLAGRFTLVEVLWDDRLPRRPKGGSAASDRRLLQRYLSEVWRTSVNLKLTTIDLRTATGSPAAELDLAAVFTDLDVQDAPKAEKELIRSRSRRDSEPSGRIPGRLPVMAAISRHSRLVILGDPGSGKSTLLNFLCVCLSGEGLGKAGADARRLGKAWQLPKLVPLSILLRDYAARGLPQGKSLWQFFRHELAAVRTSNGDLSACLPVVEEALGRPGGAILLLDGVDEVPEARGRRLDLKRAIETFASDFPRCRIVVTSRPYAYQDQEARLADFEIRTLLDFSPEQIQAFIGRWYAHVGEKDRSLGPANAGRLAGQLRRVVETHPRIAELARRPLLLTLMASLHRWRQGGNLPEKRQMLYEDSVILLIDLWQREKNRFDKDGRPIKEYDVFRELGIREEKLRKALNQLAFEAHRDQPALTGTHDITAGQIAGALFAASDDKTKVQDQPRIIRYITDRAGLLMERVQGEIYTFPHRTFQEYLAACRLAGSDFPRSLARLLRADDERWREATLLAAAKAVSGTPSAIWNLLSVLCPHNWPPPRTVVEGDWYAVLRGTQALIETEQESEVPEDEGYLIERLRTWLVQLLAHGALPARERAEAGSLLNRLPGGDPRPEVAGFPDSMWVDIPAGACWIGSEAEGAHGNERPQAYVDFPPFRIMKYPVTQAQYAEFVGATGHPAPPSEHWPGYSWQGGRPPRGKENHPVVLVSFRDAVAFCEWLSGKLGFKVCLPTEGEWEYAAKGPQPEGERERAFPWGDEFDAEKCNTVEGGTLDTSPVGMYPQGSRPGGPHEMAGNVWEWTASFYKKYPYRFEDDEGWDKRRTKTEAHRTVRGGSWYYPQGLARCANRSHVPPG